MSHIRPESQDSLLRSDYEQRLSDQISVHQATSRLSDEEYNPHQTPPDIDIARKHGLACMVGQPQLPGISYKRSQLCPCCNRVIHKEKIPLLANVKALAHLGACFPMYFQFIKFCAILLCISFVSSGLYNLYTNIQGTYCKSALNLKDGFICQISIANKLDNSQVLEHQSCVNFLSIMLMLIAIEYFRRSQRIIARDCNHNTLLPSQFSLMVHRLPLDSSKEDVERFLREKSPIGHQLNFRSIYMISNLDNYFKNLEEKQKLLSSVGGFSSARDLDISLIEDEIKSFEDRFKNGERPDFCGKALVTLEHMEHAKSLRTHFRLNQIQRLSLSIKPGEHWPPKFLGLDKVRQGDNYLRVSKAPEPSDMLWADIGASSEKKFRHRLWTYTIMFIILFIVLWLLVSFKKLFKQVEQDISAYPVISGSISFLASGVIAITNSLVGIVLRLFARKQRHSTKTGFFIFVGKLLSMLFFLNLAVITLLANFIQAIGKPKANSLSLSGLIYDAFFVFMTNPFFSATFSFCDIWYGVILLKRRKLVRNKKTAQTVTQAQANTMFENGPVDIALRYANIIKTMHFAAFYGAFIPIGFAVTIVGLFANYWMDKYLMLNRWSSPHKISRRLGKQMVGVFTRYVVIFSLANMLQYLLPIYAGTNKAITAYFSNFSFVLTISSFVVSVIYHFFLPMWRINKGIFNVRDRASNLTYEQTKDKFEETYEMLNPLTREETLHEFKMKKLLDDDSVSGSRAASVADIKFNI